MIRVLIVDDSASFRLSLHAMLEREADLKVVGWAGSGKQAVEEVLRLRPDIVTMDVRMEDMDGIEATRHILSVVGVPIIILTAHSTGDLGVRSLGAGAVDVIAKPSFSGDVERMRAQVVRSIRLLSVVKVVRRRLPEASSAPSVYRSSPSSRFRPRQARGVVAVGASTGGPGIINELLSMLPREFPWPIVVAQHIAEGFEPFLVRWWRDGTPLEVRLAERGMRLEPGNVYVASASQHLIVGRELQVENAPRAPTDSFVPSVDRLFHSVARACASAAVGLLFSGMGSDGAAGLLALHQAGAKTAVQEPSTAVVDGMPASAVALGAAQVRLVPDSIADWLCRQVGAEEVHSERSPKGQ